MQSVEGLHSMEHWKRHLTGKRALSPAPPRGVQVEYLLGLKDSFLRFPQQEEGTQHPDGDTPTPKVCTFHSIPEYIQAP